jgi:ferredoxin
MTKTLAKTLAVNPIACQGHGACAELLPGLIALDEWGYPLITNHPIPTGQVRQVRKAIAACPVLALKLREMLTVPLHTRSSGIESRSRPFLLV